MSLHCQGRRTCNNAHTTYKAGASAGTGLQLIGGAWQAPGCKHKTPSRESHCRGEHQTTTGMATDSCLQAATAHAEQASLEVAVSCM